MTDQQPKAQDPERIYLQPWSDEEERISREGYPDPDAGRCWCVDDAWPVPGDDRPGVEYVRADLYEALKRRLAEAEERAGLLEHEEFEGLSVAGWRVVRGQDGCVLLWDYDEESAVGFDDIAECFTALRRELEGVDRG